MKDRKRVLVGGASPEHEISRISAASILKILTTKSMRYLRWGLQRTESG